MRVTLQAISPLFAMRILSKVCGGRRQTATLHYYKDFVLKAKYIDFLNQHCWKYEWIQKWNKQTRAMHYLFIGTRYGGILSLSLHNTASGLERGTLQSTQHNFTVSARTHARTHTIWPHYWFLETSKYPNMLQRASHWSLSKVGYFPLKFCLKTSKHSSSFLLTVLSR